MKKILALFLAFTFVFCLTGCINKTEQNYEKLVEYIKTNGNQNGTTYSIKTSLSDLSTVWDANSGWVTISVDSANVIHLEESYSNTITRIEYKMGEQYCKIKTITNSDSGTQYISTAEFSVNTTPSSSTLKDFKADNTSLGEANARALLAGAANVLLVRTDLVLKHLGIDITVSDIGLPTGTLNYY